MNVATSIFNAPSLPPLTPPPHTPFAFVERPGGEGSCYFSCVGVVTVIVGHSLAALSLCDRSSRRREVFRGEGWWGEQWGLCGRIVAEECHF